MLYASDLAIQALGLDEDGPPWIGETAKCACCAKVILAGDSAVRDKDRFGQQFTDGPYLSAKGSGAVCGACSAIMNAQPLRALQHVVITKNGAYPIRKDVHRSWFLLTPPEPPWVAVVTDTKQAHLVWKTQPTLDNNLMFVRLGQRQLRIRHPVLLRGLQDAQIAADALFDVRGSKGTKAAGELRHPFSYLGRDIDDLRFGVIVRQIYEHPDAMRPGSELERAIHGLNQLGMGELWAMATLAKLKREVPEQPPRISLSSADDGENHDE